MNHDYNYSIIIPHKDTPDLLARLLGTIPRRDDTQVIVCDDCSTHANYAAVKALKVKYPNIELYQTDSCGGGGKARNLGLRYAKGKYLIFADSDDYFNLCFPSALKKYASTNFDIIYFTANSVDTDSFRNSFRISSHFYDGLDSYLKTRDPLDIKFKYPVPWSKFISRELVEKYKISFEESITANDVWFSAQVDFNAQLISASPLAIYCWTDRKDSTSFVIDSERLLKRIEINTRKIEYVRKKYDVPLFERDKIIADCIQLYDIGYSDVNRRLNAGLTRAGISKRDIINKRFSNAMKRMMSKCRNLIFK